MNIVCSVLVVFFCNVLFLIEVLVVFVIVKEWFFLFFESNWKLGKFDCMLCSEVFIWSRRICNCFLIWFVDVKYDNDFNYIEFVFIYIVWN